MFNFFNTKKIKKTIIKENAARGREAEEDVKAKDFWFGGWTSKKTGSGPDFVQERTDFLTGKKEIRYKEVKTGNSKLSKIQKRKIKEGEKKGIKTVVERYKNPFEW
ncbi:MAG: hypothetical protein QXG18_01720 [Candidatus Pacearchaeota archaeon]